MKKSFLVFVLFAATVSLSQAQTIKPGVGLSFANISGSSFDEAKGQVGWQFGGSIAFGNKFYFEPGVFYQTQSLEYVDANDPTPVTDANFKGIRVPVSFGLNILGNQESALALRVFGGASGFFLTSVDDDLNKDDFSSPQWGVFAGAGLDIAIIYVDLSYQWSVTDIQKDVSQIDLGKSNGIFLTAGLRF